MTSNVAIDRNFLSGYHNTAIRIPDEATGQSSLVRAGFVPAFLSSWEN